ncbi:MAG: glycosyltransferase family protein [Deltaproteobacteria bacterium]
MKILYGIQGTGNGHISRSKEIIKYLSKRAEVDILLSESQHEIDIGLPVKFRLAGLGFVFGRQGGIDYWGSVKNAKFSKFISDISALPVERYDLVISDFEPVSAWAAKMKGTASVALSHHASFLSPLTPRPKRRNRLAEAVMKWYAPCERPVGFHFEQYDSFIHTPVIREEIRCAEVRDAGHFTVYLPAFHERYILDALKAVDVRWEVFSKHHRGATYFDGNVAVHPISAGGFARSLTSCEGLLCGAGFDTPAEALFLGKKLMVVPMKGQYEQDCNAEALKRLGVAAIKKIDTNFTRALEDWINSPAPESMRAKYEYIIPDIVEQALECAANESEGSLKSLLLGGWGA